MKRHLEKELRAEEYAVARAGWARERQAKQLRDIRAHVEGRARGDVFHIVPLEASTTLCDAPLVTGTWKTKYKEECNCEGCLDFLIEAVLVGLLEIHDDVVRFPKKEKCPPKKRTRT